MILSMKITSGRLTVLEQTRDAAGRAIYRCRCRCGKETTKVVADFKKAHNRRRVQSCGCFMSERMTLKNRTHNMSRTPEYGIWHMMKDRCYNPNALQFRYYGGRGIGICQEWRDSFFAFYQAVGRRPSRNYSLDRIDNARDYEPGNVKWSSSHEQSRNRRTTRLLTAFGKTQCVTDWAKEYGLNAPSLFARLRKGIPLESALTLPLNHCSIRSFRRSTTKP